MGGHGAFVSRLTSSRSWRTPLSRGMDASFFLFLFLPLISRGPGTNQDHASGRRLGLYFYYFPFGSSFSLDTRPFHTGISYHLRRLNILRRFFSSFSHSRYARATCTTRPTIWGRTGYRFISGVYFLEIPSVIPETSGRAACEAIVFLCSFLFLGVMLVLLDGFQKRFCAFWY